MIDQGIIKEVLYGKSKKFEYQYNAPELNTGYFRQLREAKLNELHSMENYIYTDMPRMKYLCSFLDSDEVTDFTNCDNTNIARIKVNVTNDDFSKLEEFRETYFPILELASWTRRQGGFRICLPSPNTIKIEKEEKNAWGEIVGHNVTEYNERIKTTEYSREELDIINTHLNKASRLMNGYAASYYGVSNIGATIHRCKYENGGDFPNFLLKKTLSVFGKKFKGVHFDLVLYLPPTKSGDLVKNFAIKFSQVIKVPISHDLTKVRITKEQKIFQNAYSKQENVANAFDIDENIVKNKNIVLIDDIYDSGATLKEIGKLLTQKGARSIVPIVIAKTVGGTL